MGVYSPAIYRLAIHYKHERQPFQGDPVWTSGLVDERVMRMYRQAFGLESIRGEPITSAIFRCSVVITKQDMQTNEQF